ncbi:MAG: adenylosuccinate synthase, partial [Firmicutes bacterium]|nr:adenylosuccinate synthase [Bacillota bacterium]
WGEDLSGCRRWEDLPANARRYLERIETLTGLPVQLVSVGRAQEQTVERADPFAGL